MIGIDDIELYMMFSKVCSHCKHLDLKSKGNVCTAFPEGIPDEIWLGQNDHKKPYEGDNGITFERYINNI